MPFTRPSLTGLQEQAVTDILNANLPGIYGELLPQSVLRALAYAIAGMAWGHYAYLDWIAKQSTPFTANSAEYIEAWSALKGVLRNPATSATGSVTFTGTAGLVAPQGTLVQRSDGVQYSLDNDITIAAGGTGTGTITAVSTGAITNAPQNTPLYLVTAITGIKSAATASAPLVGGADLESDSALQSRMLETWAAQPTGGSASDYRLWSLQVPGCTRAWATSQALGQVTVFTMWDVVNSATGGFPIGQDGASSYETRYPIAGGQQLLCADHIFPLRPVTALVISVAPKPQAINLTIADLDPNTQAMQTAIAASITQALTNLGSPLGQTIYQSDISQAILAVPGVNHFDMTIPDEIAIAFGYLPTLGTITYT